MQALVALLLPTHFLYAFLYYTDMGAVTCIMASYLVGPYSHSPIFPSISVVTELWRSWYTVQRFRQIWHIRRLLWYTSSVRPLL